MPVDFGGARAFILQRLRGELADELYYHNVDHTTDVEAASSRLAEMEGVEEEDRLLLLTAALYHDAGYLTQYTLNEPRGVAIAAAALPRFGYSTDQIMRIGQIIMATQLPQTPEDHLQQIICDADLDTLGRDDFFINSLKIHRELAVYVERLSVREWLEGQYRFLHEHQYFTRAARQLRGAQKQRHQEELYELLNLREPANSS